MVLVKLLSWPKDLLVFIAMAVTRIYSRQGLSSYSYVLCQTKIRVNHYAVRTQDFLLNVYGLRHARLQAEHNGEPLPIDLRVDLTESLLKMDAMNNQYEDRDIWRFLQLYLNQTFGK